MPGAARMPGRRGVTRHARGGRVMPAVTPDVGVPAAVRGTKKGESRETLALFVAERPVNY